MTNSATGNANMAAPEAVSSSTGTRQGEEEESERRSGSPMQQPHTTTAQEEEDVDLTPRIGSASSREFDPPTENGPAPLFPMGVFRQTNR